MAEGRVAEMTTTFTGRALVLGCAASALTLFLVLIMTGLVGKARKEAFSTNLRSAVGAQDPHKTISVDGVSLAYTDTGGAGAVIVCLHAIGHGSRDFEDLSHRLAPTYRVIALDFPGQGNSAVDSKPASATRYAELVAGFVSGLNLRDVAFIGNSMGGAVAIRYASSYPDRVRALVLCDSGGLGPQTLVSRIFIGSFVQFFAAGRRGAFWFPKVFDLYYRRVLLKEPAKEERERIVRSAYEIAAVLEQAWRSFADPKENLIPILPTIKCPVLLAWARNDLVLPLQLSKPSFAAFTNRRLEIFDGGHAAFLEDPDRFEDRLRAFLNTEAQYDQAAHCFSVEEQSSEEAKNGGMS